MKLALWGSKKEYPTIISLLIGIFIPIIGLIFVGNQIKFKSDENDKVNGLFLISLLISLIWLGLLLILIL